MDLDSLALIFYSMNQFCIARRLDCNVLEAVAGLLSMARTAVLSANVAAQAFCFFKKKYCFCLFTIYHHIVHRKRKRTEKFNTGSHIF
jgi:hypothetical protein